jgi:chemotaxis protein MotB
LVTANGRSYSQPVLSTDGSVDPEKSRRVEFKFLLKEMEKIEEIKGIIQE